MNEGLVAITALDDDLQSEYQSSVHPEHSEPIYDLPPDFAFIGIMIGLGTSGPLGDPDPYPWVYWAPKVIPGSVKIFPMDHPEPWVKNPQVHRYPWVYL